MHRLILALALVSTAAGALPVPELRLEHPTFPDAMDAAHRGRVRLTLETNSLGCILTQKAPPEGRVTLTFEVAGGKLLRPTAKTRDPGARAFARCLPGMLKRVLMPTAPERWRFEATLVLGGDHFDMDIAGVDGPVEKLEGGGAMLRNILLAALEAPAPCTDALFAEQPPMGYVLGARATTGDDGVFVVSDVRQSTAVPPAVVQCLAERLATARFTPPAALKGSLRLVVLRPTTEPSDGPVLMIGPAD